MFKNAQLELRINKLLKVDRDETVHRVKYRPKQSIRNAGFFRSLTLQRNYLTHFKPMFHIYIPWKPQKTRRFQEIYTA